MFSLFRQRVSPAQVAGEVMTLVYGRGWLEGESFEQFRRNAQIEIDPATVRNETFWLRLAAADWVIRSHGPDTPTALAVLDAFYADFQQRINRDPNARSTVDGVRQLVQRYGEAGTAHAQAIQTQSQGLPNTVGHVFADHCGQRYNMQLITYGLISFGATVKAVQKHLQTKRIAV